MNLVYSLAYGKPYYFEVAQEMINSLRRVGYVGEIVILTDKPWKFKGAEAFPVDIQDGLWKCALGKAVRMEEYEKILFIDSDITAQNPIDSLFCKDRVSISSNWIRLKHSIGTNYFLTPSEKAFHAEDIGICSGTFSFPGKTGNKFLSLLESRWSSFDKVSVAPDIWNGQGNVQLWDECALMTMCLRGEIEWETYPASAVIFTSIPMQGANPYSFRKTILIHFIGTSGMIQNKEKTLEWMKESQNRLKVPVLLETIKAFIALNLPKSDLQKLADVCLDMGKALLEMKNEIRALKVRITELEKVENYETA